MNGRQMMKRSFAAPALGAIMRGSSGRGALPRCVPRNAAVTEPAQAAAIDSSARQHLCTCLKV